MPEKHDAEVRVHWRQDRDHLHIEVRDNQDGILEECHERPLRPFQRHEDATERATGSGLGLSTVDRIVHNLHGAIEVARRPGDGATFRNRLPQTEEAAA